MFTLKLSAEKTSYFTAKSSLDALPGIGSRTPKALARYGMKTMGQFAKLTEREVKVLLGGSGVKLWKLAQALLKEQKSIAA